MATTAETLQSFNRCAKEYTLQNGEANVADLFDLWALENPGSTEHAANVTAMNASIQDFLNGKRGTPAGQDSDALRSRYTR